MAYSVYLAADCKSSSDFRRLADEFSVECFDASHLLLERLRSSLPHLLIIHPDLADMPGTGLLRLIRETSYGKELPIILLTGVKTKESLTEAYGLGVDDFLEKPFDIREIRARIKAVLRRRYEAAETIGGIIQVGGIEIEPSQRRCTVDGVRVNLRPLEFAVLEVLMLKAGRVLSRNYLLNNVWRSEAAADIRVVDTVVSRLRKALGGRGQRIVTVSKLGYYLMPPEEASARREAAPLSRRKS